MAIHNKSHHNHALMAINKMRKDDTMKYKTSTDFVFPQKSILCLNIMDCMEFLNSIPSESVQLICIDPPYNLELAGWDIYDNYVEWAAIAIFKNSISSPNAETSLDSLKLQF